MHAIQVEDLTKVYANDTLALEKVNLTINAGDFFALLGANGAGKTTMIGIITGIVMKTKGKVHIFQYDIDRNFAEARKMIGVVPQEFNFNIFEKAQDILITQAGYFGIDRSEAIKRSEVVLKQLGLWEKRNEVSRNLSGGMKRRLMISRALVHNPKLLILDEPTAGVDVELRHGMWDYLRKLNEQGVTILLTTHYLEEVEQMCRYAAIIKNGQIIKHDKVSSLVQLLEMEAYEFTVKDMHGLDKIKKYHPSVRDANVFEVELHRNNELNDFICQVHKVGMEIIDIRPKGYRLEKLFLNIMRE